METKESKTRSQKQQAREKKKREDKIRSILVGNKFGFFILNLLNSIFKYFDRISFFYYESKLANNPVVQSGIFKNLRYPKYIPMEVLFSQNL